LKDKILFGLFVVLAFSIGFVLGGIGEDNSDTPPMTGEQVLASVTKVLEPFLADYEQRYNTLNTEKGKMQTELEATKQALATVKASGETVSMFKSQVTQQQSEIGSLKAQLQNALNDGVSWQQKFYQSQATVGETQSLLVESQAEYGKLYSKLSVVDGRASDTVNGFTADEKATFYKVWDKWWTLVIVGTD